MTQLRSFLLSWNLNSNGEDTIKHEMNRCCHINRMRVLPIDEVDRKLNRGGDFSLHLNGSSQPMEEPEGEASSQGNLVWSRASEAVG